MKKKIKIILLILLILLVGAGIFVSKFKKTEIKIPEIYTVEKEDMEFTYSLEGEVESKKTISVYSTTNGKVKNIYYRLWDSVKKGDVLLELDNSALDSINKTIDVTSIRVNDLKEKYELNKKLYDNGMIAESTLKDSYNQYKIEKIELDNLVREKNKIELSVKTPISGIITELNADSNYTIDQSKPLFKISDTDNLKVVVSLTNDKVKNLRMGNGVEITSNAIIDNQTIYGEVSTIEKISYTDQETGDAVTRINIEIGENLNLKPGDKVLAKIYYENLRDVMVVPVNYVLSDIDGKSYVYIINSENTVEKRFVELGLNDGSKYEVKSGLNKGDRVLNNSEGLFKEGEKINDNSGKSK